MISLWRRDEDFLHEVEEYSPVVPLPCSVISNPGAPRKVESIGQISPSIGERIHAITREGIPIRELIPRPHRFGRNATWMPCRSKKERGRDRW